MNRLRTYLSWKEVRKTARKEESSATKGGADVDVEDLEDDLVGQSHDSLIPLIPKSIGRKLIGWFFSVRNRAQRRKPRERK